MSEGIHISINSARMEGKTLILLCCEDAQQYVSQGKLNKISSGFHIFNPGYNLSRDHVVFRSQQSNIQWDT